MPVYLRRGLPLLVLATLLAMSSRALAQEPATETAPRFTVGEFTHIYDPSVREDEKWYINDHCIIRGPDKQWHMFGITREEPARPQDEIHFAHATAKTLLQQPWDKRQFALTVARGEPWWEAHLWAPHVVEHEGTYYMYYCAGGPDSQHYRINLATSTDLFNWKRHPENPMVVDGFDGRDPCVRREGDKWAMYYTGNRPVERGNHVVLKVTSDDLIHWGDKRVVFTHPKVGTFGGPTESPFVIERNGKQYLFVCTNTPYDNTAVYESDNSDEWKPEDQIGDFPAHCAEVLKVDDKWYVTRAGWGRGGLYIAELKWADEEE
ncbi:family 43 glycosylhydrolase [Aeoliella sp.]|uniref:family 43 glycosylhydrolase n=1 Tax=Aeoliella sp. TaxID=2795800 RepID=UPI003CCBE249